MNLLFVYVVGSHGGHGIWYIGWSKLPVRKALGFVFVARNYRNTPLLLADNTNRTDLLSAVFSICAKFALQ